jgi:hypothetical protein
MNTKSARKSTTWRAKEPARSLSLIQATTFEAQASRLVNLDHDCADALPIILVDVMADNSR